MSDQRTYPELIAKYLSGNASDSEVKELETWVLADPENKAQFMSFKKAWMLTGMEREAAKVDVDKNWKEASKQLFREAKVVEMKPVSSNRRIWYGIAAAVTLLVVASLWLLRPTTDTAPMIVQAEQETLEVELPDKSQITLNKGTSLEYVAETKTKRRTVALDGDAFFEVEPDKERPFVIQTQGLQITVLGTAFYVDARKDQAEVQVIVTEGVVEVRAGGEVDTLLADEKVVFEKDTESLVKQGNEDANFLSFKTDTLRFVDTPLDEVAFALNRQYGVEVQVGQDALQSCRLDGVYPNLSLEATLELIEETLEGIQVQRQGDQIRLTGICKEE